jgi:hypothetical protein
MRKIPTDETCSAKVRQDATPVSAPDQASSLSTIVLDALRRTDAAHEVVELPGRTLHWTQRGTQRGTQRQTQASADTCPLTSLGSLLLDHATVAAAIHRSRVAASFDDSQPAEGSR